MRLAASTVILTKCLTTVFATVLATTLVTTSVVHAQTEDQSGGYQDSLFAEEFRHTKWERVKRLSGSGSYWRNEIATIEFFEQVSENDQATLRISSKEVTSYDYVSNEKSEDFYSGISTWDEGDRVEISAGFAGSYTLLRHAPGGGECLLPARGSAPVDCFKRK